MDIVPIDLLPMIVTTLKILVVLGGLAVVAVNYFQTKEAKKMEGKLDIPFPDSVNLAMSLQVTISAIFLFASILLLALV